MKMGDLSMAHVHDDGVPRLHATPGICRPGRLGKTHKLPFPGHFTRSTAVADVIHSDILGPLEKSYPGETKYVATFMDEYSRFLFVGFMHPKKRCLDQFPSSSEGD